MSTTLAPNCAATVLMMLLSWSVSCADRRNLPGPQDDAAVNVTVAGSTEPSGNGCPVPPAAAGIPIP